MDYSMIFIRCYYKISSLSVFIKSLPKFFENWSLFASNSLRHVLIVLDTLWGVNRVGKFCPKKVIQIGGVKLSTYMTHKLTAKVWGRNWKFSFLEFFISFLNFFWDSFLGQISLWFVKEWYLGWHWVSRLISLYFC